jgi:Holliday junction resolvase
MINEDRHAGRVMKYQFSCEAECRVPIYRVRRERAYREYFRMKMSGRSVERLFQFHRPFRGKSAFKISAYRPRFGLVEFSAEDMATGTVCVENPALGSVRDLKGMVAKPEKAVSLDEIDRII